MKKVFLILTILFLINNLFSQNCFSGTDEPPGCFIECNYWSANNQPFTADTISWDTFCTRGDLTRWFRLKPANSEISIRANRFNCNSGAEFRVQVYYYDYSHSKYSPISICETYNTDDFSAYLKTGWANEIEELLVRVESNKLIGCDFELIFEGIETENDFEFLGDDLFTSGKIFVDVPAIGNEFIWSTRIPTTVIESGQGTSSITYSKPRFEHGDICLDISYKCPFPDIDCVRLLADKSNCDSNWETFPGCDFKCHSWWVLEEPFGNSTSKCNGKLFSKWLKVIASSTSIVIFADQFGCDFGNEYDLQIYDDQQNAIGSCTTISPNNYRVISFQANELTIGKSYSVSVESTKDFGCDMNLRFIGIEVETIREVEEIYFDSSDGSTVDNASIAAIRDAESYKWEIRDPELQIISGQGTTEINFENPDGKTVEICVTPVSDCKVGIEKCQMTQLPINPLRIPCCSSPNIPFGCKESGTTINSSCTVCNASGVYSGSNFGYPPGNDFSCGIADNSAYIALISQSGKVEATVHLDNCNLGDGLELIL